MDNKKKYLLSKDCIIAPVVDGIILLNLDTGKYSEANLTGKSIIYLIKENAMTSDEIIKACSDKFPNERIESDIREFLTLALKEGVIQIEN